MSLPSVADLLSRALEHHRNGRLTEAESLCRDALERDATSLEARQRLGLIALQTGRADAAVAWLEPVLAHDPQSADTLRLLAQAHTRAGRIHQALTCLRRRAHAFPDGVDAWIDYATLGQRAGVTAEAITAYRQAIRLRPDQAALHANLGALLRLSGEPAAARTCLETALTLDPALPEIHALLGRVWQDLGDSSAAEQAYRQARKAAPELVSAHLDLGNLLLLSGRVAEAVIVFEESVATCPESADLHVSLGNALRSAGRTDAAVPSFVQALALAPQHPAALNSLANARLDQGRPVEAVAGFRAAMVAAPGEPSYLSNLILALHYEEAPAPSLREAFATWNQRFPPSAAPLPRTHPRVTPTRLRVGLIGPDFRDHPVGRFLVGLFAHARTCGLDLFIYSDVLREDPLTLRLRAGAAIWRPIAGQSDETVSRQIASDRLDVLVDLALHTSGNRLPLFARRPAPAQVSYLGYAGGTGVHAIPYRITDSVLDPPGAAPSLYPEKRVRLESPYWCYTPPDVLPLPLHGSGAPTFGCLGNPCKVSPRALDAWASILVRMPGARFVLHATSEEQRRTVLARWGGSGIASDRVDFVGRLPFPDYLALCARIDVMLDTFPFNGATTTCDALWMGTPVVTCTGPHPFSRSGASILQAAGLGENITYSIDDYGSRACTLAESSERRRELRTGLREQLRGAPLLDAPAFTRAFARALASLADQP